MWKKNRDVTRKAICKSCSLDKPARRQLRERQKWQQDTYTCSRCTKNLPPHKFNTAVLARLENENQLYLATCGICQNVENENTDKSTEKKVECNLCRVKKPVTAYSPARQRRRGDYNNWRCMECDFPSCESCGKKPQDPKTKPYRCNACSFPPCECGAARPQSSKYHTRTCKPEYRNWKCQRCKGKVA